MGTSRERLRSPQTGARPRARWLHPVLPVDVELEADRARRVAPVVQD
ncbi:hypothetical protein ACWGB8_28750 [Kitasatospora sp. NPDC054939]